MFYPRWVFELWAQGAGDIICANDYDLPISKLQRLLWRVRGHTLHFLFGWWWQRPTVDECRVQDKGDSLAESELSNDEIDTDYEVWANL